MNFKYYDVLSSLIMGYVALVIGMYLLQIEYNNDYTIAYLAMAFLCGYFINAVSGLLEPLYYLTIGGKPSNRLLNDGKGNHGWFYHLFIPRNTGIWRVHFYETERARSLLSKEIESGSISEDRLFNIAKLEVSGNQDSRVPDFSANYALARSIFTMTIISTGLIISSYPNNWQSYISIIVLLVSWNRYKERAYYYAREVLNEYLKQHKE